MNNKLNKVLWIVIKISMSIAAFNVFGIEIGIFVSVLSFVESICNENSTVEA